MSLVLNENVSGVRVFVDESTEIGIQQSIYFKNDKGIFYRVITQKEGDSYKIVKTSAFNK